MSSPTRYTIRLRKPHAKQEAFINSEAKCKVICAGRRSGKTTGAAWVAVKRFMEEKRVLYAAPTAEQVGSFWDEVTRVLAPLTNDGTFIKNETEHTIEW